jgi:DNA polymerase-4
MNTLSFNPQSSHKMHIDLNSCFATIEQQANPLLRGKPIAVAAYASPGGCILAPSIEAKKYGIKTGMRVRDGKKLYKDLIVLPSDPWKYRNVHLKLRNIISEYTNDFYPKSIDEFVLDLKDYPAYKKGMKNVGNELKKRIKEEIGEWLTVSVGIAPNKYLAKIAAGLRKPDGLDEINCKNFLNIYSQLKLTDLTGIKERNAWRLNSVGIYSVREFYEAPVWKLRAAFHSITGLYWHTRLSGYEVDNVEFARRSYGNSSAIGATVITKEEVLPILSNLVEKMSARLRHAGYQARGIHLTVLYKDGDWWHRGELVQKTLFDSRDIFKESVRILRHYHIDKPVANVAVSTFNLIKADHLQLNFFEDVERKNEVMKAVDDVNDRWGDFVVRPGRMLATKHKVLDRIAFGGVKELEEFTLAH